MARNFDGTGDYIQFGIGACDFGYGSMMAIVRRTTDGTWDSILGLHNSSGVSQLSLEIQSTTGWISFWNGTATNTNNAPTILVANGWVLCGFTKATGTVAPRFHKYVYNTDTWSQQNSGATSANAGSVSGGHIKIGRLDATDDFIGDIAVVGFWGGVVLTDDQVRALAHDLSNWYGATGLWVLDQQSASMNVPDLSGGGANQTSVANTTQSTSSVPVLGYGQPVLHATRTAGGTTHSGAAQVSASSTVTAVASLSRGTYADLVLSHANLVAYWRLGDAGSTQEELVANNDGTLGAGALAGQAGALVGNGDTCVGLDGVNDFVGLPTTTPDLSGGACTFEAWVKRAGSASGLVYGGYNTSSPFNGFGVFVNYPSAGNLSWWDATGGAWRTSSGTIPSTGFHHVVITVSSGTVSFYIDGSAAGTASSSNPTAWTGTKSIGSMSDGASSFFWGYVDEVALYTSALSASDVLAHYQAGAGGVTHNGQAQVTAASTVTAAGTVGGITHSGAAQVTVGSTVTASGYSDLVGVAQVTAPASTVTATATLLLLTLGQAQITATSTITAAARMLVGGASAEVVAASTITVQTRNVIGSGALFVTEAFSIAVIGEARILILTPEPPGDLVLTPEDGLTLTLTPESP